jgi:hypothetical protein
MVYIIPEYSRRVKKLERGCCCLKTWMRSKIRVRITIVVNLASHVDSDASVGGIKSGPLLIEQRAAFEIRYRKSLPFLGL